MLGKDARSKLAAGAAVCLAAVGLSAGAAHAGQQQPAPPKADPFISVHDVVTNVGQRPKLVVTYGNAGGRALHWVDYGCWIKDTDGSVKHLKFTHNTYRSPLLPGQSANFELEGKAVKPGRTKVQCYIAGFEKESEKDRYAASNVATIRVVR
jgi:hypothetical protein